MQLKFRKTGTFLVVTPEGDLDHHSASEVREQIDNKLQSTKAKNLIFNLNKLQFMDSSGLGLILGRFNKASEIGTEFTLLNPADSVRKILDVAGIARMIKIERKK